MTETATDPLTRAERAVQRGKAQVLEAESVLLRRKADLSQAEIALAQANGAQPEQTKAMRAVAVSLREEADRMKVRADAAYRKIFKEDK